MSLIVQKFGGSSVKNAERVASVAKRVVSEYDRGNSVVVVVSAQGDTTDDLIKKAYEINASPSKREMDMLLATGEQISISLLAMAIEKLGRPVISLTGWQAGVKTDSNYSAARIKEIDCERLKAELARRKIVIVAGFQGINKYDDIITLGRGGSDTSAVALAAALHADLCEIYTDVDGVYTADPRIVANAFKLNDISYDEMLELASLGANVLHNRSVEMAKKYHINLVVRSSYTDNEGTYIKEMGKVENMLVRGVTRDNDCARITLSDVEDRTGSVYQIFSRLSSKGISVDVIVQDFGKDGLKDISFTVAEKDLEEAKAILSSSFEEIGIGGMSCGSDVSKVSIVGVGMVNNAGVATMMFEALAKANIGIQMISTSEIKITVLVKREDADKAVRVLHEKFIG